tara:strand:- start:227 stop:1129 length:903 start_codon:yes stop_codon:yes gene_type:complete
MSNENVIEEIEEEIKKAKGDPEEFEIEITNDPQEEVDDIVAEEAAAAPEDPKGKRSPAVEKRIKKLVADRNKREDDLRVQVERNAQLEARLARLEQSSVKSDEANFNKVYSQTKIDLHNAIEEGDTEAVVAQNEKLANLAAMARLAEYQRNNQQQRPQQQRPQQQRPQQQPTPPQAMAWWKENESWFEVEGFEKESKAARLIDAALENEGHDMNTKEYFDELNNRLLQTFPGLISNTSPSKPRVKSRTPVAPTTGGSSNYKDNNRVRVTKDELSMARELGINTEEGLKIYESEIRKAKRS